MEKLRISKITNTLDQHVVVLRDDNGVDIVIHPGETLSGMLRLTIPYIEAGKQLENSLIRHFRTECDGEVTQYTFTCKEGRGLISALGPDTIHFSPPSNLHVSIPEVVAGQTVALTFNIDSDNITWIIGDIDSL